MGGVISTCVYYWLYCTSLSIALAYTCSPPCSLGTSSIYWIAMTLWSVRRLSVNPDLPMALMFAFPLCLTRLVPGKMYKSDVTTLSSSHNIQA